MGLFRDNETNRLNETQHGLKSQLVGEKPVTGYLHGWPRISTRNYREQMQLATREGNELGTSQLQVQRPKHSVVICLVVLFAVSAFFKAETRLFFLRKACELYHNKLRERRPRGPLVFRPFSGNSLYYNFTSFMGYRKRLPNSITISWLLRIRNFEPYDYTFSGRPDNYSFVMCVFLHLNS